MLMWSLFSREIPYRCKRPDRSEFPTVARSRPGLLSRRLRSLANRRRDPDRGCFRGVSVVSPIVEGFDPQRAAYRGLVAVGTAGMAWLAAELEISVVSAEPGEKPSSATHTVRAVELLDAASDWKVVAASFTEVRSLDRLRESLGPIPSPTPAEPLMKLLAAPDELAASLSADPVVVFGTDKAERAIGQAAAKALLSKWRKIPLAIEEGDKVREVRTAGWGFAIADVNIPKPGGAPYRMSGFLVAVPAPNGSWSVVAVNYGAL
jgi:hypothetical protein